MKYLILTASTGEGHNKAASNLREEIEKNSDICIVVDILKKNKLPIIEKSYEILAKTVPDFYGFLYKISNNRFVNNLIVRNILLTTIFRIKKVIEKEKPDIIISTHPFSVPIMERLKKIFKIKVPFVQIVTDFKAHYAYVGDFVDAYITASEFTKESLIKRNIDENKIHVFGIPISDEFKTKNNFKKDGFNILIMGGSMGLKSMQKSIEVLMKANLNVSVDIVCGRNKKLKKKLEKKFEKEILDSRIKVHGYTNKISEMMDKSKLLVTKPGGLTTSEAINKNLPMIIPFCIPGQEKENTAFLVESNMALEINKIDLLPEYIKKLIENENLYNEMVENMQRLSKGYSIKEIINLTKKLK